jgi:RNA polymerase sigma-70 factor (ECF subfamily)
MDSSGTSAPAPGPGAQEAPGLDGLLTGVGGGDHGAFEAVYDRLAGPAYGLICRIVGDTAQAEEVVQEVLLEVWRTAARFDPAKGSAASWVLTIAQRRAIDRVRSAAAAGRRELKTATVAPSQDEVADSVQAALDREQVRRCLEALSEVQRESITLAYYGGNTYRQVSRLLGVALGTVKSRIRDGLLRMRDCLGAAW